MEEAYQAMRADVAARGLHQRRYLFYGLLFCGIVFGIGVSLYIITLTDNVYVQVLNAVFLALVIIQGGFLGHDFSHRQVFTSDRANSYCSLVMWGLFTGLSEEWWFKRHSVHHQHVNQLGLDPDLNFSFAFNEKLLQVKSSFFRKYILPYQHFLYFFVLPTMYLEIISGQIYMFRSPSIRTLFELPLMLIHYSILAYFIFGFLPFSTALLFLGVHMLSGGFYMANAFAPNHKGELISDQNVSLTWINQITSTRNLSRTWPVFAIFGGLNFQIEHHLFSTTPRISYWKIQPIVKEFCDKNGIAYHETSWLGSQKEIYASLKRIADTSHT